MLWLILTLSCIVLWSISDILYRASSDRNDPISPHKHFIWIGIIMALAGYIMSTWSNTLLESVKILRNDVLYLVPLCFLRRIKWI